VIKLEVLPATTGCRPPGRPAGEHEIDYTSSYLDMAEVGCRTGASDSQVHHAVDVAMYRCRRCDTALLAVSPADSDQPAALFEVFGAQGPDQ
jgi:hypothetical protein